MNLSQVSIFKVNLFVYFSLCFFQCYYLGGTSDAATSILSDLTKPLSWGMPADKVCFKLYKKDEQICELKYGEI